VQLAFLFHLSKQKNFYSKINPTSAKSQGMDKTYHGGEAENASVHDATFRERNGQAAVGNIVRGVQ